MYTYHDVNIAWLNKIQKTLVMCNHQNRVLGSQETIHCMSYIFKCIDIQS
jgi:hypothetical protein